MGAYDNWKDLKKKLENRCYKYPLDFSHQVLIMMDEIEKEDIDDMYNTIRICYSEIFDSAPTLEDMERLLNIMPEDLKRHADQWGWDDTEVRDNVYEWMEKKFKG